MLCITPAGLSSRDWLLRFWHHTGASCWFGAVSKAGWLDGLWQVLFLSPPSSCSLSLSRDTHSSLALSLYTRFSSCILTQSSARASRRQLAAAEERAGRQLQPPLQQIVPPVPWKLSGRVAEGMEGRAARQVGPAIRNLLRYKSHRFSPFSCLFYFFRIFFCLVGFTKLLFFVIFFCSGPCKESVASIIV